MKIFISWSGEKSSAVATALKSWLPCVINVLDPWLSIEDIEKGTPWSKSLSKKLKKSLVSIICLTRTNLRAPWLLYEAGAISKTLDNTYVCPYLIDLEKKELKGPLAQFQLTKADKQDTKRLIKTLNRALGNQALPETRLNESFKKLWPDLKKTLQKIQKDPKFSQKIVIDEREMYSRIVPSQNIDSSMLSKFGDLVEEIRCICLNRLKKMYSKRKIEDDSIRANVFLPDYRTSNPQGYAFKLYMPSQLRRQMNYPPEHGIRFYPGEGATGIVFDEGQQKIILHKDFLLSERHKSQIHPELKWIISTPLKGTKGTTQAVLNIDGIRRDLNRESIKQLANLIESKVAQLCKILDQAMKAKISIKYGELNE